MSKYHDDRVSSPIPPSLYRKFRNATCICGLWNWYTVYRIYRKSLKAVGQPKTWFVKLKKKSFSNGKRKSANGHGVWFDKFLSLELATTVDGTYWEKTISGEPPRKPPVTKTYNQVLNFVANPYLNCKIYKLAQLYNLTNSRHLLGENHQCTVVGSHQENHHHPKQSPKSPVNKTYKSLRPQTSIEPITKC